MRLHNLAAAVLLGASMLTPNTQAQHLSADGAVQTFNFIADQYFSDVYFHFAPTAGTSAGLHQYDTAARGLLRREHPETNRGPPHLREEDRSHRPLGPRRLRRRRPRNPPQQHPQPAPHPRGHPSLGEEPRHLLLRRHQLRLRHHGAPLRLHQRPPQIRWSSAKN